MNIPSTRLRFYLLFPALLCYFLLPAQLTIWPGDINNNGVVNGKDVLRWGYAYGQQGPIRVRHEQAWKGYPMDQLWPRSFPGETNMAFADCDGNGIVNNADLNNELSRNFGLTHGTLQPDYCPIGVYDIDPELKLTTDRAYYAPGQRVQVYVSLGTQDLPLDDFYGISMRVRIDEKMIKSGAVTFSPIANPWYDAEETDSRSFFYYDKNDGLSELAIVRTDQQGVAGHGRIGIFSFVVRNAIQGNLPTALPITVDLVQLIDSELNILPVAYEKTLPVIISDTDPAGNCPQVIDPVCGSDGNTYLNSCYAEAAGVSDYTPGVCYSDCIDPDRIQPESDCPAQVAPVCGCNLVTYINPCEAEAAGIMSYTNGPCNQSDEDQSCYDPILVVQSAGTEVDPGSGIITLNCPEDNDADDAVCGCNGITYPSSCIAEANGISAYTKGSCNDGCVDPEKIDPAADCATTYEPVCGCNDVTYTNACEAEAAGLLSYTPGVCGQSSNWCDTAIPIQCGDFLAQETSIGAGNDISRYPGCSNVTFAGPDQVYVFNKTSAGDLQIGLEIITPGVDLDLFLLLANCEEVQCIRSSKTDNSTSNNEGIILEDAPLGTYYIVVDAQYADVAAEYRLELSCGYLYCGDALELECGVPFNYNNTNGRDDVSLYACGSRIFNVENNGPEVVHYFTTTSAGEVEISLSGMSANLELILLRSCDRGDCIKYSQQPGTNNESITAFLDPGTYYIVVDGNNGATSNYTLQVDCTNTCDLAITDISTSASTCGTNTGTIAVSTQGGTPGYITYFDGPISGNFSTSASSYTITKLPPGTYTIRQIDSRGCEDEETVTIYSTGALEATITPTHAICQEPGFLSVSISQGQPPYRIYLTGAKEDELATDNDFFRISNLEPGTYDVYIVDALGCSITRKSTVQYRESDFNFVTRSFPAGCGELGSIQVTTQGGTSPYKVQLSGPVSSNTSTDDPSFDIPKLPGGNYQITVTDANGCRFVRSVTVGTIGLEIAAAADNGICGELGAILVQITQGSGLLTVNWSGPVSGTRFTTQSNYLIPDLPSGNYQIEVVDEDECVGYEIVTVNNSGENLATEVQAFDGTCGGPGTLRVEIQNGQGPYTITWEGAASGQRTISQNATSIPDLPDGLYKITIADRNMCSDEHSVYINTGPAVGISLTGFNGNCGQPGSIRAAIEGGSPNYIISWSGPVNGSEAISEQEYELQDLPSGNYQISVTDRAGCTDVADIVIENAAGFLELATEMTAATCALNGALDLKVSGGDAPYEIVWEGPFSGSGATDVAGDLNISDLPPGSYQLTATDQNGCTGTTMVQVASEEGNLMLALQGTDQVCTRLGQIEVNIQQGSPGYTIRWDGTSSGQTTTDEPSIIIDDLAAGSYSVSVVDQIGCQAVGNITLEATGDMQVSVTPRSGLCGRGSIDIAVQNGSPTYQLSWVGPVEGSTTTDNPNYTIVNLPDGIYNVELRDANGCADAMEVQLFSGSSPFLSATPLPGSCGDNGGISIDISGGVPTYQLSWAGTINGSSLVTGNHYDIDDLPSGNYRITIIDDNGCQDQLVVSLFNESTDLSMNSGLTFNECGQRNSVRVNIGGGVPDYTVSWTGPQNGNQQTSGSIFDIKDLSAGNYNIVVTDNQGCRVSSTISVPVAPINLFAITPQSGVCSRPGRVDVTITGGTPTYTLSWTGPVNGSLTTDATETTIPSLPSGDYSLVLSDANGCSDTRLFSLDNEENDLTSEAEIINNICSLPNTIRLAVFGGSRPYNIEWQGPESGAGTTGEDEFIIPDLPAGTYEVQAVDQRGCTITHTMTIEETAIELISLSAERGSCGNGGTINVTINDGTPGYSIVWEGPISGSDDIDGSEFAINDLASGSYTVRVTDANGCTEAQTISLQNTPALQAQIVGENGDCFKDAIIRINVSSGSPSYSISWDGPMSGNITTTDAQWVIEDLITGIYDVTITDARGCAQQKTITVLGGGSNFAISAQALSGTCGEEGMISIDINGGSPDYTISWQGPGSEAGTLKTNGSSYNLLGLPGGTYEVEVKDRNGCDDRKTVVLPEKTEFTAQLRAINGACEELGDIRIDFRGRPPYDLSWSGPASGTDGVNSGFYRIPDLPSGLYTIEITDADGCFFTDQAEVINVENDLQIDLQALDSACDQPGSIQVNITGGSSAFHIEWSDGATEGSASVNGRQYTIQDLSPGIYTVRVEGSKECTQEQQVEISQVEEPISVITTVQQPVCDLNGAIGITLSGAFPDFDIAWSGPNEGSMMRGEGSYEIGQLTGGTYQLEITDRRGCTYTEEIVLQTNTDLEATITGQDGNCDNAPAITIRIQQGSPGYTIAWDGPLSGETTVDVGQYHIENLTAGTYNVRVTDNNGCTSIQNMTLNGSGHQLSLAATPFGGTCGRPGTIEVAIGGPVQDFRLNWSGPVSGNANIRASTHLIESLPSGTYTIGVTDEFGCHREETVAIFNGNPLQAAFTPMPGQCDEPGSIAIAFPRLGAYALNWNGPSSGLMIVEGTSHTIPDLPSGTYDIEITDAQDCTFSQQLTLTNEVTDLQFSLTADDAICDKTGTIELQITGGDAAYLIDWNSDEVSGSESVSDNDYLIGELPAGNYSISVTDANGCIRTQNITIAQQESSLEMTANPVDGACGQPAGIELQINNASSELSVSWDGPVSGTRIIAGSSYLIDGLPGGTFVVMVTDENGCSVSRELTVANKAAWNAFPAPVNGACQQLGAIDLTFDQPGNYTINWAGPDEGQATVAGTSYNIPDLPSGIYELLITDADGCEFSSQVNVQNAVNDLVLDARPSPGGCAQSATIQLGITGGQANYIIRWRGEAAEGTVTITGDSYEITELPPGDYRINVTDSQGCEQASEVTVDPPVNTLDFAATVKHPECGEVGTITVAIQGGAPDYTINWSGPTGGFVVQGHGQYVIDGLAAGEYVVEVVDGGGCIRSRTIAVTTEGGGDATFQHSTNVLTVNFRRNSIGGTSAWDFGDGSTSTENNPTYEYCEPGTYTACVLVTDECGTSEHCETINVSVPAGTVVLDVGEMTASAGSTVSIPVTIENCPLLVSLAGTLQMEEGSVARISGVTAAAIAPQYNAANGTFNYYHNEGAGVPLQNGDILFYIEVEVRGAPGTSSVIRIINNPLKIEVGSMENDQAVILPHVSRKGSISVAQHADINGRVYTYWGEGIPGAAVHLNNTEHSTSVTTDAGGIFTLPEISWGQEYTLTAEKDVFPFNGLSTYALFIGQRFILGMQPSQISSPYQIIGGDANCNDSFTTLDLFIIQQLIIGATDDFRYCPSWVFATDPQQMPDDFDAYNVFPYQNKTTLTLTNDTTANFIGVKVGDILGHANPAALRGDQSAEPRSPRYLSLQAVNGSARAGELIELVLSSNEFVDMVSYQFTLEFDAQRLEYVERVENAQTPWSTAALGTRWAERGDLALSWFSEQGTGVNADPDETLLRLRFRAREDIADISLLFDIQNMPVRAEAHQSDGERFGLRLEWNKTGDGTVASAPFHLYQNVPNPAGRSTMVEFDLPADESGKLTVHDKLGRIVMTSSGNYPAGRNRIVLDTYQLAAGVYYYTLQAGPYAATRSMVILE